MATIDDKATLLTAEKQHEPMVFACVDAGDPILRIAPDGTATLAEGVTLDDASRAFWERVAKTCPFRHELAKQPEKASLIEEAVGLKLSGEVDATQFMQRADVVEVIGRFEASRRDALPVDEAELFSEVFWPILAALEQQASGGVVDAGVIAGKVVTKLIPFLRTPAQQEPPHREVTEEEIIGLFAARFFAKAHWKTSPTLAIEQAFKELKRAGIVHASGKEGL